MTGGQVHCHFFAAAMYLSPCHSHLFCYTYSFVRIFLSFFCLSVYLFSSHPQNLYITAPQIRNSAMSAHMGMGDVYQAPSVYFVNSGISA